MGYSDTKEGFNSPQLESQNNHLDSTARDVFGLEEGHGVIVDLVRFTRKKIADLL